MSQRKGQPAAGRDAAFAHGEALGFLLARAHALVRARMTAVLEGGPLHLGHVVLLSSLQAQNDLTQVQLAQMSGIEKSSVVLFLDALESDGWVERRPHPSDRRAHCVHLTAKGRAQFRELGRGLQRAERDALCVLNVAEREQLQGLLLRLIAHLQD
jgi:DNA-binding MarR family transcriptional regulator